MFTSGADGVGWLNPVSGVDAGFAVDGDFALLDEGVTGSPRGNASRGKEFVESSAAV